MLMGWHSQNSGREPMPVVSREQLLGWVSVVLGVALGFAGVFELATGQFMPGGYHDDRSWLLSSVWLRAFRDWGPYLSGAIWLVLASVCLRMGLRILQDAREGQRSRRRPL
jgi:hypothetical protein